MFDFIRRGQLAVGDIGRRIAMKVVGGLIVAVGAGFLLAALWSWLAVTLSWGPTLASLAIGGGFAVIGIILIVMSSKAKHEMPTSDDVKREVEARIALAADAAVTRVRSEAVDLLGTAESKVHSLMDSAGSRATEFAYQTEDRIKSVARGAADSVGLTSERVSAARHSLENAGEKVRVASNTNAGSVSKLVGAFALGVAIAAKIQGSRGLDDAYYDRDDYS